jgi:hypothetical protein
VEETIGGAAVFNSMGGIVLSCNGASMEQVGALRAEMIKGGKSETTGANKLETVGVYLVDAKETFTVAAKAALVVNISGGQRQKISGGHSLSAKGPVVLSGSRLNLNGKETITLTVGKCKVMLKSDGISVEGASKPTVLKADKIELDESELG